MNQEKDKKQRIIETAENYFTTYGFKATTMDQVAKGAGVAKGTIYNFYKDKEEIYLEVIKQNLRNIRSLAAEAAEGEDNLLDKLKKMILAVDKYRQEDPFYKQITQEARDLSNPLVKQGLNEIEAEVVNQIQELFTESIKNQEIREVDTRLSAFVFLKAYWGYVYEWPYEERDINKFLAFMEVLLKKGLFI